MKEKVKKNRLWHKAARWRNRYPYCDPNCKNDYAWVTDRWEIVNCKKCLERRRNPNFKHGKRTKKK